MQRFMERFTKNQENILTKIKTLTESIDSEFQRPLRNLLIRTKKKCLYDYASALDELHGLQNYMGSVVDFASRAAVIDIWRRPVRSLYIIHHKTNLCEWNFIAPYMLRKRWYNIFTCYIVASWFGSDQTCLDGLIISHTNTPNWNIMHMCW